MILIQLCVHCAYLPLTVRVIEGAIDGRRSDAKPRCGDAIDNQRCRQASGLLVGGDIGKLRQLLHLVDKPVSPQVQLIGVWVFQRVLVLRAADAVVHRNVLHRLHEKFDAFNLLEVLLQPANHVGSADAARVQRLQVDGHPPAVQRGVGPIRAYKGRQALDCWILKNNASQLLLLLFHGRERNCRRRLRDTLNLTRILSREKAFGNDDVENNRKNQSCSSYQQCDGLVPQDKFESTAVKGDDTLEDPLGGFEEAALLFFGSAAQNSRTHHGRQRQGDDCGQNDGDGQRNREFAKETANNSAHEEQRDQHCDQ